MGLFDSKTTITEEQHQAALSEATMGLKESLTAKETSITNLGAELDSVRKENSELIEKVSALETENTALKAAVPAPAGDGNASDGAEGESTQFKVDPNSASQKYLDELLG